jgi:hypothetical protein
MVPQLYDALGDPTDPTSAARGVSADVTSKCIEKYMARMDQRVLRACVACGVRPVDDQGSFVPLSALSAHQYTHLELAAFDLMPDNKKQIISSYLSTSGSRLSSNKKNIHLSWHDFRSLFTAIVQVSLAPRTGTRRSPLLALL